MLHWSIVNKFFTRIYGRRVTEFACVRDTEARTLVYASGNCLLLFIIYCQLHQIEPIYPPQNFNNKSLLSVIQIFFHWRMFMRELYYFVISGILSFRALDYNLLSNVKLNGSGRSRYIGCCTVLFVISVQCHTYWFTLV